jgi:hypothetical protein
VKLDNTIKELPKQLSEEVEENGVIRILRMPSHVS